MQNNLDELYRLYKIHSDKRNVLIYSNGKIIYDYIPKSCDFIESYNVDINDINVDKGCQISYGESQFFLKIDSRIVCTGETFMDNNSLKLKLNYDDPKIYQDFIDQISNIEKEICKSEHLIYKDNIVKIIREDKYIKAKIKNYTKIYYNDKTNPKLYIDQNGIDHIIYDKRGLDISMIDPKLYDVKFIPIIYLDKIYNSDDNKCSLISVGFYEIEVLSIINKKTNNRLLSTLNRLLNNKNSDISASISTYLDNK